MKKSVCLGEILIGKRKDGKEFITEIKAALLKNKYGKSIGLVGTFSDITERYRTQDELRKAKEYADNIINSSLDMIVAVDKDRRIVQFNKAARETFGYSEEEIVGKHVNVLYKNEGEGKEISSQILKNGIFILLVSLYKYEVLMFKY